MTIIPFLQRVDQVIINPLILLVFVLATLYFLYGIVKFLDPNTGEKDKIDARNAMLWGIVGMAIMFSVYGLMAFVLNTFGVGNGKQITGTNVIQPCTYVSTVSTASGTKPPPCPLPSQ